MAANTRDDAGMRRKKLGGVGLAFFGLFFCGIASVIMGASAIDVRDQARKLVAGIAVPAQVVSSEIQNKPSKKKTRYRPVVTFSYTVDHREFRASTVHPREVTLSDWHQAKTIIDRHPIGSQTTAYYDPLSVGEAYLERAVDFMPYLGIIFPLLHFSIGLSVILLSLKKTDDPLRNTRRMGVVLLADVVIVVLAFVHYFSIGGKTDLSVSVTGGVVGSVLLACGWWWSRSYAKALNPPAAPITSSDS